ncbi:MAG: MBL fold metallo-hydrolase [Planctomycetota bacterium]|nr:MBL fold metallo-hydrolase [Planctomycetota bacterium]
MSPLRFRVIASPPNVASQESISKLRIETFALGSFLTNCYVVYVEGSSACWIVDASFEPTELIHAVRSRELAPEAIILTHAHVDHIAGVSEVRQALGPIPVWMHDAERDWLREPKLNLSWMMGQLVTAPGPDRTLSDGETLTLSGTQWRVLHTPGHSPGGISLVCAGASLVLAGDTLFAGSVGRTDFPGSDHDTLMTSIRTKLFALPDATRVLPGHGPETTVGQERRSNPYVGME